MQTESATSPRQDAPWSSAASGNICLRHVLTALITRAAKQSRSSTIRRDSNTGNTNRPLSSSGKRAIPCFSNRQTAGQARMADWSHKKWKIKRFYSSVSCGEEYHFIWNAARFPMELLFFHLEFPAGPVLASPQNLWNHNRQTFLYSWTIVVLIIEIPWPLNLNIS